MQVNFSRQVNLPCFRTKGKKAIVQCLEKAAKSNDSSMRSWCSSICVHVNTIALGSQGKRTNHAASDNPGNDNKYPSFSHAFNRRINARFSAASST
jgi:hypothetical protein